jgi:ribosome-associated translation inhibitor RaiA
MQIHMSVPLAITFHGMLPSPAVEVAISRWVDRLERVYDRIQRCHVWIDQPHRHQRQGARFQVRIALSVPGREIAVVHDPGRSDVHDSIYPAIADAFGAVRRQLQEHAQIRRGEVKARVA